VEKQGKELLALYTEPEEQAKIYFMLAHVYGQSGILYHPNQITKYARLALKDERDPVQRAWLNMYLGCAAEVDPDASLRNFAAKRKRAAAAYLEGYKEILALKLPDKVPEVPVMAVDNSDDRSGDILSLVQRWRKRYQMAMAIQARRDADFIREMLHFREVLSRQVVELYRRSPAADEELRDLAGQVLQDKQAVEVLIARVRQK